MASSASNNPSAGRVHSGEWVKATPSNKSSRSSSASGREIGTRPLSASLREVASRTDIAYSRTVSRPNSEIGGDASAGQTSKNLRPKPLPKMNGETTRKANEAFSTQVASLYPEADRKEESRGMEPKFVAKKAWDPKSDDDKLFKNEEHKFNMAGKAILTAIKKSIDGTTKVDLPPDPEVIDLLDAAVNAAEAGSLDTENLNNNPPEVKDFLRAYTKATQAKFQQTHFVKLDYKKEDGSNTVTQDMARTRALANRKLPGIAKLAAPAVANVMAQQKSTTVREVNYAAVTEGLAAGIYDTLGFKGAKVKVREGSYADGTPKLYLDSTEARGPKGEKAQTFKKSIIKEASKNSVAGHFQKNMIVATNSRGETVQARIDTGKLAIGLGPALLMGDYDKWGASGDNMLFYLDETQTPPVAVPLNIDPGNALTDPPKGMTDLLRHNKGIHSNATFDQPMVTKRDQLRKGYKNFTLFNDTKLSERMQGIKEILDDDKWSKVEAQFDAAIEEYTNGDKPDVDFAKELGELKEVLNNRREYFAEVFGNRAKLSDNELDLVDNLEKLTSPTRSGTKAKDVDGNTIDVEFEHLEVLPQTRNEWNMTKDGETATLKYEGKNADQVEKQLKKYLGDQSQISVLREGNAVSFTITSDALDPALTSLFSEEGIRAYK